MDSKWRVIDLTGFKGFLSYERGKLKVGDGPSVPLADLEFILVGQGFDIMQLSVYCKYYLSSNSVRKDITILMSNVPAGGAVRILKVTDQQWASTLHFVGPKEVAVEVPPEQLMIF